MLIRLKNIFTIIQNIQNEARIAFVNPAFVCVPMCTVIDWFRALFSDLGFSL